MVTITGQVIILIINLIIWYFTFFKTKKLIRTCTPDERWSGVKYGEWQRTNERYKWPMWLFLLWTALMFFPVISFTITITLYVLYFILDACEMFDDFMKTERPKVLLQEFLTKKV